MPSILRRAFDAFAGNDPIAIGEAFEPFGSLVTHVDAPLLRMLGVEDTGKGMRPSFSGGAHPSDAERLYDYFVARARESGVPTETGRFAADMKVRLLNDGPVTFWLQV